MFAVEAGSASGVWARLAGANAAKGEWCFLLAKGYNGLGVIDVAVPRECIKALIDRLTDKQAEALRVILESMAWPKERITPEEAAELEEGKAEIQAGKYDKPMTFGASLEFEIVFSLRDKKHLKTLDRSVAVR